MLRLSRKRKRRTEEIMKTIWKEKERKRQKKKARKTVMGEGVGREGGE